jgi:hypothetical protein
VIELDAFAADCRVFGEVDLGDRRLTDMLNEVDELRIGNARLESLVDGHVAESDELVVSRDELFAVVAVGPRGSAARRLHTHASKVVAELGPYHVAGSIHGTAASNPLAGVLRRAPWVPLTDAVIAYRRGAHDVHEAYETLLINRAVASSIRADIDETTPHLPWEGPQAPLVRSMGALDLTRSGLDEVPDEPTE